MPSQDHGFVSIIVASILMVIMTLITIGFTQIMQREQRQALDRQLSTQAYYAAESAINDFSVALEAFYNDPTTYPLLEEKRECDTTQYPAFNDGKIDGADGEISYTCLQYDLTPINVEVNNGGIKTDQSKVIPIRSNSGSNIENITVSWEHHEGNYNISNDCSPGSNRFPASRTNAVPIMRIDLVRLPQTSSGGTIDREAVISETPNLYLTPKDGCGATEINYTDHNEPDEKGQIVDVLCQQGAEPRVCNLKINIDVPDPDKTDYFVIRLRSIYANANVTLEAEEESGDQFEFKNAQILVDTTGKANDVVRRLQVRLKAEAQDAADNPIPEPVFQAMDGFCKLLTVAPPGSPNLPDGKVELNKGNCP